MSPEQRSAVASVHAATAIYTAGPIIDELLDAVGWPHQRRRLLDPSAGDGSVLVQAIAKLAPPPDDFVAMKRIVGIEFMESAAEVARWRVSTALMGIGWSKASAVRAAETSVVSADFLFEQDRYGGFDLIVGNPPYLRYSRLPDYFKAAYPAIVPKLAMADLLHAFLEACTRRLEPGGVIAMVTADRWLLNDSAADLRAEIGRTLKVVDLQRLDVATCFYRPKDRRKGSPPRVHPVRVILGTSDGQVLSRSPFSPDGVLPATGGQVLADVAKVRIAPWLGPVGIFVLRAEDARWLPAGSYAPAVDTDDFGADDVLRAPTRVAIITERAAPAATVMEHLRVATERLSERGRRSPYWLPPETVTLSLKEPSLLVPRIARHVRAIEVPPGTLPINHNLSVVGSGSMSLAEIKAILLHPDSQDWVRAHALRLENNFLSITTSLLRRLPLPNSATVITAE